MVFERRPSSWLRLDKPAPDGSLYATHQKRKKRNPLRLRLIIFSGAEGEISQVGNNYLKSLGVASQRSPLICIDLQPIRNRLARSAIIERNGKKSTKNNE